MAKHTALMLFRFVNIGVFQIKRDSVKEHHGITDFFSFSHSELDSESAKIQRMLIYWNWTSKLRLMHFAALEIPPWHTWLFVFLERCHNNIRWTNSWECNVLTKSSENQYVTKLRTSYLAQYLLAVLCFLIMLLLNKIEWLFMRNGFMGF